MSTPQEEYKIFFDDVPVALIRTDIETGKILMANNFAASMLGYESVEDLLQENVNNFYHNSDRSVLIKELKEKGVVEKEINLTLKNGKKVWLKTKMRINCGGSCIEGYLTDITASVKMKEEQLAKLQVMSKKIDKMVALAE